jgi:hypothetical protein
VTYYERSSDVQQLLLTVADEGVAADCNVRGCVL